MKKIILLAILLLAIVPLASAEVTLTSNLIRYEPLPAQPGQYVTVFVEIENTGNEDARNTIIELPNQFPFSVTGEQQKEIGTIKSQQSYVITYQLRVDSQAVVGNNELVVRYSPDGKNLWKEDRHAIRVQPTGASLSVTDIMMTPEEIAPGEEGTIQITIKNTADVLLRDISLQLGMVSIVGSNVIDLPFIPTNSVTEKRISRLAPDKQTILSFTVKSYPTASPGYYKLPLSMTFYDQEGTETQQDDYIGVVVKAVPELKIYVDDNEKLVQGQEGEVSLKFVNKGVSDLKFLDVEILPGEGYDLVGRPQAYVGDLDSDDYRTETFSITPNKESVELLVQHTYKDDNNVEYETTETVVVDCGCTDKNGNQQTSPWIIALVIVVILTIIVVSRRRKQRHKKRK
ncbi:hypothetical protein K9M74_05025 [Candidatus Woesearchaeota archaeon]|nr:hypothetical protein [Candidatus Woesearchaeota archaeon]